MAARNYQPTLRKLAKTMQVFIARYQAAIQAGLSADQALVFASFLEALDNLVSVLGAGGGV